MQARNAPTDRFYVRADVSGVLPAGDGVGDSSPMSKQRTVTPIWLDVLLLAVAVYLLAVALSPLAGSSGP